MTSSESVYRYSLCCFKVHVESCHFLTKFRLVKSILFQCDIEKGIITYKKQSDKERCFV